MGRPKKEVTDGTENNAQVAVDAAVNAEAVEPVAVPVDESSTDAGNLEAQHPEDAAAEAALDSTTAPEGSDVDSESAAEAVDAENSTSDDASTASEETAFQQEDATGVSAAGEGTTSPVEPQEEFDTMSGPVIHDEPHVVTFPPNSPIRIYKAPVATARYISYHGAVTLMPYDGASEFVPCTYIVRGVGVATGFIRRSV